MKFTNATIQLKTVSGATLPTDRSDETEDRSPERQNDEKNGEEYGFDGGQLMKGRKRFIFVDPWRLLISVRVIKANCSEQKGEMVVVDETDEAALKSMQ